MIQILNKYPVFDTCMTIGETSILKNSKILEISYFVDYTSYYSLNLYFEKFIRLIILQPKGDEIK